MRLNWHIKTLYHNDMWAKVLRRDPCVYCGERTPGTVEHVDPRGSRSVVSNGVGACRACNNERGSVPVLFYLLWRSTDRSEIFRRWNFRLFGAHICQRQRDRKARVLVEEARARTLRVPMAEFLPNPSGETPAGDAP